MGPEIRLVVLAFGLAMNTAACKKGEIATPKLSQAPEINLHVVPRITRLPAGENVGSMTHYMIARYESKRLACSQIDYSRGGSVKSPVYEVHLKGSYEDGFTVWMDLVQPDRCDWKLSGLIYGVKVDGKTRIETGVGANQLKLPSITRYCAWGGMANGRCLGFAKRSPADREQADTVLVINMRRQ